jgi:hypothetical protein
MHKVRKNDLKSKAATIEKQKRHICGFSIKELRAC